ncbi:MAG TPA: outer membrane protein [Hyphomicrobiales bacterium]|nr:outer membrane protein [Hyphomicrobiales bacterium]
MATAPSQAADLPQVAPTYAAPPAPVSAYDWTGLYLGINGGYGWGRANNNAGINFSGTDGGLVGGTLGYNWQWGHLVAGLETDFDWADMSQRNAAVPATARVGWLGTFRGRIGYAMDRVLFYGTGGVAYGDVTLSSAGTRDSNTNVGWTVGGGVEFAVWQNLTAKIEYKYVDLGRSTVTPAALGPTNIGWRGSIVTAGINYKFW